MALLEVKDLTTVVSGYTILNHLNFRYEENELRVLLGAQRSRQDDAHRDDHGPVQTHVRHDCIQRRGYHRPSSGRDFSLRYQPEIPSPQHVRNAFVYENIMISLHGDRKVFKYMLKRVTPRRTKSLEILEFMELAARANEPADTLSHGERQWLELAMLVASNPKLLLLDEPTTGMTEEGKRRTANLIQRVARNHTVLLVEHDMHVVRQIAKKVTVMHQGEILAEGPGRGCRERDGQSSLPRKGAGVH